MKQPILTISLGLVLLFPSLYRLIASDNDAQHNVQLAREIATDLGKSDIVSEIRRNADLSFTPMLDIEKVKAIVLRDLDKAKHNYEGKIDKIPFINPTNGTFTVESNTATVPCFVSTNGSMICNGVRAEGK